MKKRPFVFCFLQFYLIAVISLPVFSQNKCKDCYWVDLKLRDVNLSPIAGASVKVSSADGQSASFSSPANGVQGVQLELYKTYTVTITKKGYAVVVITIDTHLKGKEGKINLYYESEILIPLCDAQADKSFSAKLKYDQPSNHFATDNSYILKLKEGHKYTTDELHQLCDQLLKSSPANNTDPQYTDLIAQAEKAYGSGDYPKALDLFTQASKIKPGEKYPKDKIMTINIMMKDPNQRYKLTVESAEAFYKLKKYTEALTAYEEAAKIKPKEKLPKDKIAEIKTVMIKNSVTRADMAFQKKDYKKSKEMYLEVTAIDPKHKWAIEQLAEIEKLTKGMSVDISAAPKDYNKLMANADKLFAAKDYVNAKDMCMQALRVKPNEKAPKDRIAEIDKIIAKEPKKYEAQIGKKYSLYMNKGNKFFEAKDFENAKLEYNDALVWKPGQKFILGRLAEIDKLNKEVTEKYNALIAQADKDLTIKSYSKAKAAYEEALTIKPNEQYPKDKLAAIEKSITMEFNIVVKRADEAFSKKDYEIAKKEYSLSLTIKANDAYALKQLAESEKQLLLVKKAMNDIAGLTDFDKMKTQAEAEAYITQKEITNMQIAQEARSRQINREKKARKKQLANMNSKYDTKNPLTELYNEIDKIYADQKVKK